jgi:hypothetical protein
MDETTPDDAMLAENEPAASEQNSPGLSSPESESLATGTGSIANLVSNEESARREEKIRDEKRRGRRLKEKESPKTTIFETVARRFQVCGRCSIFLAECAAKLDAKILDDALQQLQADREKEWLVLPWELDIRLMVFKTYATPDDHDYDYFDGHCPECGRRFIYHVHPLQETPPSFRLHL